MRFKIFIYLPSKQQGSVLIICLVVLCLMMFLAGYFLTSALSGSKMSQAQEAGAKTYYLAEAGIAEALFKLSNDPIWKTAFETLPSPSDPNCSAWAIAPFERNPALFDGASYTVAITNIGCAQAEIESLAKLQFAPNMVSQRVVRARAFRAMGNSVSEYSIFLGGPSENLDVSFTNPMNIHNGSLFSNKAIRVSSFSVVNVDDKALAGQNITVSGFSQLNATSCADNICEPGCDMAVDCPPASVAMPALDFDSGAVGSYLYEAGLNNCASIRNDGKTNCVFTPSEFEKAMWNHYPLFSLPSNVVVYITGDFNLRGGQDLIVNGTLVSGRDVKIGEDLCWSRSEPPFVRCGFSRLRVVRPGVPTDNFPSGILAKRKFSVGNWLDIAQTAMDVNGLVYAGDEMRLSSALAPIVIHGALLARKISFSSMWGGVNIYLDSDVIVDTLKDPQYSPVITIEHWEEEY